MREISPASNATSDQYLTTLPTHVQALVAAIRTAKAEGTRPLPSTKLLDQSALLTAPRRAALVDKVATLVDENLSGRSDMCEQFAVLLAMALTHMGIPARAAAGEAIYYDANGSKIWQWAHAWVRADGEVIDGNVDSLWENPVVPKTVTPAPYWGPIQRTPKDRKLREGSRQPAPDGDVQVHWWPDLRAWLNGEFAAL